MLTRFSYCVIVARPRRSEANANADAVAAALLNMVFTYSGPRQTIIQGLDLRNDQHKAHVLRFLEPSSLTHTPLFFSSNLQQFTPPGLVSLQMLIDVVSQIIPSPQPVDEGIKILTEFSERGQLTFSETWADVLEAAETMRTSPEVKLRQSSFVANRSPQFVNTSRASVSAEDILRNQASLKAGAGMGGREVLGLAGVSLPEAPDPRDPESRARSMRFREAPQGLTQAETSYITGMQEYADVSVFSKMKDETETTDEGDREMAGAGRGAAGAGGGRAGGIGVAAGRSANASIESRMFSKIPNIRNVSEGKQLVERDLTKGFSTDPAEMEQQIKAARYERAQLTKQWRGGSDGAGRLR